MTARTLLILVLSVTCMGQAAAQGRLYWGVEDDTSERELILSSDLNGAHQDTLFETTKWWLYNLAANPISGEVCFVYQSFETLLSGIACIENGTLSEILDGEDPHDYFENPVFDGADNKLYYYKDNEFTDVGTGDAIISLDLTTREREVTALPGFAYPFDIDPNTHKVYYHYLSYVPNQETIEGIGEANLDGTEFNLLVKFESDTGCCRDFTGLAVDAVRGYVYWTKYDSGDETAEISRIRTDGTKRETFFSSQRSLPSLHSIPYGGSYLYVIYGAGDEELVPAIGRLALDGSTGIEEVIEIEGEPGGFATYLAAPTILVEGGPANGEEEVEITPTLNWVDAEGATSYNLQITEGTDFDAGKSSGLVVDTTGLQDSKFDVPAGTLQPGTSYSWRIQTVTSSGNQAWTSPFSFTTTSTSVGIESEEGTPVAIALLQNYPNPFNPRTRIPFKLEKAGFTTLSIYNVLGQKVATLVAEHLPAGSHEVTWNSEGFPSGTYLCRLQVGRAIESRVLSLVK